MSEEEKKAISELAETLLAGMRLNYYGMVGIAQCAEYLYDKGYRRQSEDRWIDINERQPERHARVLCYYKYEPDSPDVVCENTYYGRKADGYLWMSDSSKVTHWMPLPELPKGNE